MSKFLQHNLMSMVVLIILAVTVSGQVEKIDAITEDNNDSSIAEKVEGPKHNGGGMETAELVGAGAAGLLGGLIVGAALGGEGGYNYYPGAYGGSPYYPNNPYPYYPNPGYQQPSVGYLPLRPQGPYFPPYGDTVLTYPGYYAELLHGNIETTSLPAESSKLYKQRNATTSPNGQQEFRPFYYHHQTVNDHDDQSIVLIQPEEDDNVAGYFSGNNPIMYQDEFQLY